MSSLDIVRAIRAINKDAQIVVYGDDLDTCTIQWDVGTEISKADIKAKMAELETKEADDAAKRETDKANANQKLKDLGLTDDEIKAIKGIE
jgi:hypothetical protein